MAVRISKDRVYIPTWKNNHQLPIDEQIRVKYHSVTVDDMFEIQRQTKVNLFAPKATVVEDPDSMEKHWELMKFVLGKYTTSWHGVEEDGITLTDPKDVLAAMGVDCLDLLSEVYGQVIASSSVTPTDAKNSGAGFEPASADLSLTVLPVGATISRPNEIVAAST